MDGHDEGGTAPAGDTAFASASDAGRVIASEAAKSATEADATPSRSAVPPDLRTVQASDSQFWGDSLDGVFVGGGNTPLSSALPAAAQPLAYGDDGTPQNAGGTPQDVNATPIAAAANGYASGAGQSAVMSYGYGTGSGGSGSGPYTIGDRVWNDYDLDGFQDVDEPGMPGVEITLYKQMQSGSVTYFGAIGSVMSGPGGEYKFDNAVGLSGNGSGQFYIQVNLPAGGEFSPPFQAAVDKDSNVDPLTGRSDVFGMGSPLYYPGSNNPHWENITIDVGLRILKADIDIPGSANGQPFNDASEQSLGGLVVRRAEGNNAPRKAVIVQRLTDFVSGMDIPNPAVPGDVQTKLTITGGAKIDLYDAQAGGANVASGKVFDQKDLPKTLWVEGKAGSGAMKDVEIHVEPVTANPRPPQVDYVAFTVVWVTVSLKFDQTVSNGNDAKDFWRTNADLSHVDPSPLDWGLYSIRTGNPAFGHAYEAKGEVAPAGFRYPGVTTKLDRDAAFGSYDYNPITGAQTLHSGKPYSGAVPGNDTSAEVVRDDDPDTLFDLDAARIELTPANQNWVRRLRFNLKEFAVVEGVRASALIEGFVRFSIRQYGGGAGTPANDWALVTPPAIGWVAGDAEAGPGQTNMTWNLQ